MHRPDEIHTSLHPGLPLQVLLQLLRILALGYDYWRAHIGVYLELLLYEFFRIYAQVASIHRVLGARLRFGLARCWSITHYVRLLSGSWLYSDQIGGLRGQGLQALTICWLHISFMSLP